MFQTKKLLCYFLRKEHCVLSDLHGKHNVKNVSKVCLSTESQSNCVLFFVDNAVANDRPTRLMFLTPGEFNFTEKII